MKLQKEGETQNLHMSMQTNLNAVLGEELVSAQEGGDEIWLASFMDYDLGFFDEDFGRVEPAVNPWLLEKV